MTHFDPDLGRSAPPGRPALHPYEQAARDVVHAAFLNALVKVLIILAAAVALIFVVGP
jgi:hypothetical protein